MGRERVYVESTATTLAGSSATPAPSSPSRPLAAVLNDTGVLVTASRAEAFDPVELVHREMIVLRADAGGRTHLEELGRTGSLRIGALLFRVVPFTFFRPPGGGRPPAESPTATLPAVLTGVAPGARYRGYDMEFTGLRQPTGTDGGSVGSPSPFVLPTGSLPHGRRRRDPVAAPWSTPTQPFGRWPKSGWPRTRPAPASPPAMWRPACSDPPPPTRPKEPTAARPAPSNSCRGTLAPGNRPPSCSRWPHGCAAASPRTPCMRPPPSASKARAASSGCSTAAPHFLPHTPLPPSARPCSTPPAT